MQAQDVAGSHPEPANTEAAPEAAPNSRGMPDLRRDLNPSAADFLPGGAPVPDVGTHESVCGRGTAADDTARESVATREREASSGRCVVLKGGNSKYLHREIRRTMAESGPVSKVTLHLDTSGKTGHALVEFASSDGVKALLSSIGASLKIEGRDCTLKVVEKRSDPRGLRLTGITLILYHSCPWGQASCLLRYQVLRPVLDTESSGHWWP